MSSKPLPVTLEVKKIGARLSVCMWRAHVSVSSNVRACSMTPLSQALPFSRQVQRTELLLIY